LRIISSLLVAFPTGDWNAKNVAKYQPTAFAAIEGIFETEHAGAEIVSIGQPNIIG
jgi:cytochrome d ubiquinol oxidase subunit I